MINLGRRQAEVLPHRGKTNTHIIEKDEANTEGVGGLNLMAVMLMTIQVTKLLI
jgi:hypothetical protein